MNIFKRIYIFILYHQRQYNKVLKLTNFTEKNLPKNMVPIRYQAYTSFYTKNYRHSEYCFDILKENNKLLSKDHNYIAFMHARHNEKDKAISEWCLALEKDNSNKNAKYALDYIRSKAKEINLMEDEYFDNVMPKEPSIMPIKTISIFILGSMLIVVLAFSTLFLVNKIRDRISQKNSIRKELSQIYLPDYNPNLLNTPKENNIKYSYTEKDIKKKFENIKTLIMNDNVVQAQKQINEIRLSNASNAVKMKMDILETFIYEPDYAIFKNVIGYEEFLEKIDVYNNIYINWQGRVVNLEIEEDRIIFDLIIGNEEMGVIKGIIPVIFKKAVIINNNDILNIFGNIRIYEKEPYIEGKYIIKTNIENKL